jgi:N-methylhydantoinase B
VVETAEPGVANTAGDGVRHGATGMGGGNDGTPHRYRLLSNGSTRVLRTKEVGVVVQPGDVFLVESGGGGGWAGLGAAWAACSSSERIRRMEERMSSIEGS